MYWAILQILQLQKNVVRIKWELIVDSYAGFMNNNAMKFFVIYHGTLPTFGRVLGINYCSHRPHGPPLHFFWTSHQTPQHQLL